MKFLSAILATAMLAQLEADSQWVDRLAFWAWGDLQNMDNRIQELDTKLSRLPELAMINSSIRVGLKTGYTTAEDVRWIELTLPQEAPVDTIVLVPPLAKGANAVVAGYGFPIRFKLETFDLNNNAYTILDRTTEDFPNPGCFPVLARFPTQPVKKVRFTATDPWSVDGPEILALAEMLVLSGKRNLAINATVTSSSTRNAPRAWTRNNLVDLVTPLGLPVAPQANSSRGYHSAVSSTADEKKSITLALPEIIELDELRLFPVRRPEVPLWFDYGFPVLYHVEVATRPDFSDAALLYEVTDSLTPLPGMNPVCIPGKNIPAKFIRITADKLWYRRSDYVFALAEIQVLRDGENLASKATFTATDKLEDEDASAWSLEALKDGLTESGRILDFPDWFAQLDERRLLEAELHQLKDQRMAMVQHTYHQLVYGSVSGAGAVSLILGILLWRQRSQRLSDAQRMHDKLARDLHDEIGSNLGSITLICSIASQPDATPESIRADIAEIERVAEETADSMRDMVDIIRKPSGSEGQDWLDVLHRLTERLLRGMHLDCALPAAPLTSEPDIETRREIYLFCKEVLHNIARHSGASRVRFHVIPTPSGLRVEITDNGTGFDPAQASTGHGLGNLRERAASMRARLHLSSTPGEGTLIHLDLHRTHRWQSC